jgi:hypothetical protein
LAREHALDLKRPFDAEAADLVSREAGDIAAAEIDFARSCREEAGDQVEERRFAGAVGADDGVELPARQRQGQVVDGGQAAEPLR